MRNKPCYEPKFPDKSKGGRPTKWDKEDLQMLVDTYFERCKNEGKKPLITGLCNFLEILHDTFNEWEYNTEKGFSDICKMARQRIIESIEEDLTNTGTNTQGQLFRLKNIGRNNWKDRVEHSGDDNLKKSNEEYKQLLGSMLKLMLESRTRRDITPQSQEISHEN